MRWTQETRRADDVRAVQSSAVRRAQVKRRANEDNWKQVMRREKMTGELLKVRVNISGDGACLRNAEGEVGVPGVGWRHLLNP